MILLTRSKQFQIFKLIAIAGFRLKIKACSKIGIILRILVRNRCLRNGVEKMRLK